MAKIAVATNKMYSTTELFSTLDAAISNYEEQGFEVTRNTNTQADWSRGGVIMERDDHNAGLWKVLAPEFVGPEIINITLRDVK